jgi:hypothetical protein
LRKFDITIKTKDKDASPELNELAVIMIRLRYYTDYWHEHHGVKARQNMQNWKNRADQWIYEHISPTDKQKIIDATNG